MATAVLDAPPSRDLPLVKATQGRPPPLLSIERLSLVFRTRSGTVQALEDVSFAVGAGETVAVVGESGSGKSVTAYAVMGLQDPAARITQGAILFDNQDLVTASQRDLAKLRGSAMAMIFQNPRTALNPIRTTGDQIADVIRRHDRVSAREAADRAVEMLKLVRITDPARRARAYPFEMSGGMCQRVMIALALAAKPKMLIADEPTTGIDVTTQAVIMDLVSDLAAERGMATMLITHDLGLAAERASRVVVMHAGHVVEDAPVGIVFSGARHPYTSALVKATPAPGIDFATLASVPGNLPDLRRTDLPTCRYSARCPRRLPACDGALPRAAVTPAHLVACHNPTGDTP